MGRPVRLQLASDLHLEMLSGMFPGERLIAPARGADLLVLAGDIASGTDAVRLFADWPVPVLLIPGNHEFYGRSWEQTRGELRAAAVGTSVVVLDNEVADLTRFPYWSAPRQSELARLRFLGTTLWTDYRYPSAHTSQHNMAVATQHIADHRRIRTAEGPFRAEQALQDHIHSRRWLESELMRPFQGKTIVVSHHGPHPLSVHPRWLAPSTMALNSAFVSDLAPLLAKADLWLHGHVHDSFDYTVGQCRVIVNPRGYAYGRSRARIAADLVFENSAFRSACLVDV